MALSNINTLSQEAYFSLLYDMIKQRENPWLYAGTGYDGIHNGGGDGNPTFGYGFNLAAFDENVVERVILHAYGGALSSQQSDGLDLILDWKIGAAIWIDGQYRALTNANILNLADDSLNGAPGAVGSSAQRSSIQSLTLTDAQATRMLDVMIKGELNLVHIEGPSGSYGYEAGLDYRLTEEGPLPYSTEQAALLSVYYNAPSLIGPGVQNAIASDDRPQLWYEIRYNHNAYDHNGLQSRRAEEADLLGLVSQAAKADPDSYIEEYASALDTIFNDYDRLGRRILTRIEERDGLDDLQAAMATELQVLLDHYVLQPLGATSAPMIDYVQSDSMNISTRIDAKSAAEAGVSGGRGAAQTVNLILGKGGDDLIYGLGAADYLYGGAGDDTVYGDGEGTSVDESGHDLLDGGGGNDLLIGGHGDEYISGGPGRDILDGGGGRNHLRGGHGADTLQGGADPDILRGEEGKDRLQGGVGADSLDGGVDNDTLRGAAGNDALNGGDGADKIFGGQGADDVNGGSGRDRLRPEAGNDTVDGGAGDDRIFGSYGWDSLMGGGDGDHIDGNGGNDTLDGGVEADTLIGNFGWDSLDGGADNDRLIGSSGNDVIAGGGGDDTFIFSLGDDADSIVDFTAGAASDDVIELSGFGAAFDTFAEVQAAASQVGADVVIDFGGGDTITLKSASLGDLHQDDFMFG